MAALPSSSSSEPAVMEQVITDVFAKSVHTILESRSPNVSVLNYSADPCDPSSSSSFSSNLRSWDRCFNLTPRDCAAAPESFDLWRQSNPGPLVVDVILCRRKAVKNEGRSSPGGIFVRNLSSERDELDRRNINEKIVERWIVQCESQGNSHPRGESSSRGCKEGSRGVRQSSEFQVAFRKASKRIIVLLRSLYSALRLLPAYKLFRDLTASGTKIYSIFLSHRISSFAEPFSREEDSEMSQLDFGPADIFSRKFSLSVAYLKTLENVSSDPSNRMSSELVMDYVGSPLADPHRWFPSRPISGSAPSHAAFCRQHSWCTDNGETPSPSHSPSYTYSNFRTQDHNLNPAFHHRQYLHQNVASSCSIACVSSAAHSKKCKDLCPSPPFSPSSSSSSTPSRLYGALLRSESAPGSIPLFRQNQCLSASSCSSRKIQGCSSQLDALGAQVNVTSAPKTLPPKNQLQFEKESLSFMEFQTGMPLSKTAFTGKESAGHITGFKTPCSLPHRQSRTSSRLFFMDEFDDSDFICHFAEDVEGKYTCRAKSGDGGSHAGENLTAGRSPDAAVGALVWMLKSAPPLRLHNSNTRKSMPVFKGKVSSQKSQLEKMKSNRESDALKADSTQCLDITTPEPFKPKTAADAFRELRDYKCIRELIIKQSGSQLRDVEHIAESEIR